MPHVHMLYRHYVTPHSSDTALSDLAGIHPPHTRGCVVLESRSREWYRDHTMVCYVLIATSVQYMYMYTVLCAKRVENGFLHTFGIISVILHPIHTQDIST